jgi:hypothetical protein
VETVVKEGQQQHALLNNCWKFGVFSILYKNKDWINLLKEQLKNIHSFSHNSIVKYYTNDM